MEKAIQTFIEHAMPYRNTVYAKHKRSGEWYKSRVKLTNKRIEEAMFGEKTFGYLSSSYTKLMSIDIDDHISIKSWVGNTPSIPLYKKYKQAISAIGITPSMVIKTPRGLHVTWYFNEKAPTRAVSGACERLFKGIGVEIRPTMKNALRIANLMNRIDPAYFSPKSYKDEYKIYRLTELLGEYYLPKNEEDIKSARKSGIGVFKAEKKVLETLGKGSTNDELCYIMGVYKSTGYSIEKAIERFKKLLSSANYSGSLLNDNELSRRAESLYKGVKYSPKAINVDISKHNKFVSGLMEIVKPNISKRAAPIMEGIIKAILEYKEKMETIYQDHGMRAEHNAYNTFFIHNMRHGFIPLPSKMLVNINANYNRHIKILRACGFLVQSDEKYKVGAYCKHYFIETNLDYINTQFDSFEEVNKEQYYENIVKVRNRVKK